MQYLPMLTMFISIFAIGLSISNIRYIKKRDAERNAYYKNRKNK